MGGSMKTDRDVMELARDKLSVEQIATKLKITPKTVIKTGRRLGIYLRPLRKPDGRRKTK
jgi:DNA-binding CsgD family transcriptional regulator